MNMLDRARKLPRWALAVAGVLVAAFVLAGVYSGVTKIGKTTITAYFPSTSGLYQGDEVRVLGVHVGRIDSIEPGKERVKVEMTIDRGIDLPADARAVIISPSLVSARFIQLAPAYVSGPKMRDGAEIPLERTAVPVEWDDIKAELSKLATTLGPVGDDTQGSFGRFVNTAADNMDGNGQKLRDTLRELSATLNTLSDGRTDLFGTVRNLQKFVKVLSASNEQIVQFGGRLASVSSVLAGTSAELGAGLDNLDTALGDVKRFLDGSGAELTEGVQRLAAVTQQLVDKRPELERVLHSGPTALVNFYQIYKPAQGTLSGAVSLNNTADPLSFLCGSVRALETNDSDRSADLCAQYLAPVISSLAMNYAPIMLNPATGVHAFPNQIEYSPPSLADRAPAPGPPPITVPNGVAGLAIPGGGR
ncbi:phospholipid/cholesterol/gamma-HCH transport system substrate-binding protein [Nocardia tenerifensis]|uniref:Phospholipid/cholesterol/gamma-HCH transport system substrate-binding protein n=1 Tax=Nocardia tenerifensis TaxID=228006 RepID=A0A318KAX7_9NOCA|nr:MCE family protein [Nocardia tenerifensis]PXX66955.1 phospholipid/cholesterol/gamma-HCH transport system substrate-binding protein [Nocardia tenerifensis]